MEKNDAILTVYFGAQKMRLEFSEKGKEATNDIIVVALDSGTVAILNNGAKTYRLKNLLKRDLSGYKSKQIAGYVAEPVASAPSLSNGYNELFGQSVFYVANNLYFPVPEMYKGNTELIAVNNNKVVLGAEIFVAPRSYGRALTAQDSAEMAQNRINAEAVEVKPYQPETSLFSIPADFTPAPVYDYSSDSTAVSTDSIDSVMLPPPMAPKKKKTKPANKKSNGQKSPAYRRKSG